MATPAQRRATAKYKARKRLERLAQGPIARKRKPNGASRDWNHSGFKQASAPPSRGLLYCDRCEEFGHGLDEHLSPYANDHFIPTDGGYTRKAGAE